LCAQPCAEGDGVGGRTDHVGGAGLVGAGDDGDAGRCYPSEHCKATHPWFPRSQIVLLDPLETRMQVFSYTLPAVRGTQAGRTYYIAMCPLRLVPRLLPMEHERLRPELQLQPLLNTR